MAIVTARRRSALDPPYVLAPERYDFRRELRSGEHGVPLSRIAHASRAVLPHLRGVVREAACVVLDTSDARDGIIVGRCTEVPRTALGSAKKLVCPGDVLVSRLRPYLRQIAWVDPGFADTHPGRVLACSTEYHVLTSVDGESIAFLVPWLLGPDVQRALAAAQEGGHHPRVGESALMGLRVSEGVILARTQTSDAVADAIASYRTVERSMNTLVAASVHPLTP